MGITLAGLDQPDRLDQRGDVHHLAAFLAALDKAPNANEDPDARERPQNEPVVQAEKPGIGDRAVLAPAVLLRCRHASARFLIRSAGRPHPAPARAPQARPASPRLTQLPPSPPWRQIPR